MQPKQLIVSIHDVRPGLFGNVRSMLNLLAAEGVTQTSLLVIPNFHREEPIEQQPELVTELKRLQEAGHEIVLHALYHREDPPPTRQSAFEYIVSRHYTSGEGEFYRLDKATALERIAAGQELFKRLDFKADGFTAPAWLYSEDTVSAIRERGFKYYTTLWGVQPMVHDEFIRARAVVWSHRAAWRRMTSNACLPWIASRIIRNGGVLRIALHPPDFNYLSIRDCALKILRQALQAGYQATTYRALVDKSASDRNLLKASRARDTRVQQSR